MAEKIRLSGPTLKLLKCLLEDPRIGRSGASISKATGIGSGTLYPLLQRLEFAQWIVGEWENADPSDLGRPLRRFYKLTRSGQAEATKALNEFQFSPREVPTWN